MSRNNLTEANLQEANVKKTNNTKVQNVAVREVVANEEAYQNLLRRYWELEAIEAASKGKPVKTETTNFTEEHVKIKEENPSTKYPAHLLESTPFEQILAGLQQIENPLHREIAIDMVNSIGPQGFQKLVQDANKAAAANQANANTQPSQTPQVDSVSPQSGNDASSSNNDSFDNEDDFNQSADNSEFDDVRTDQNHSSDSNQLPYKDSGRTENRSEQNPSSKSYFLDDLRALLEPKCRKACKQYCLDYAELRKDTVVIISKLSVRAYGPFLIERKYTLVTISDKQPAFVSEAHKQHSKLRRIKQMDFGRTNRPSLSFED